MLDDLDDLGVTIAGQLNCCEIAISDVAAILRNDSCEANSGIGLGVVGGAVAIGGDFCVIELGQVFPQEGVRRKAIITAIDLRDSKGDPFTRGCRQRALVQRSGHAEIPFQGLGAGGNEEEQVGHRAQLLADGFQKRLSGVWSIGDGGGLRDAGHGRFFRWVRPSLAGEVHLPTSMIREYLLLVQRNLPLYGRVVDRFEAMRTLVAAVDAGSLSAASRKLGVPLPTVSRRVSDLESHLRAQLLMRTSRKLLLTEVGRAYVATCRQILLELDDAEKLATGEYRHPRGELAITAPVMFGQMHVEPVVLDFLRAYPEIAIRLTLADYFIDLTENRLDLALRIGDLPDSGLVARRLGAVRWITCASPAYLTARGVPEAPDDLTDHDCLGFERSHADILWPFVVSGAPKNIPIHPRFSANTARTVIDAALAGAGIARVLSYQVADEIANGRLIDVLTPYQTEALPVHLVHSGQPILPLKLRAFLDFAAPRLKNRLR